MGHRLFLGSAAPHRQYEGRAPERGALVRDNGMLFLAIYNDQGGVSQVWKIIKHGYNKNILTRWLIAGLIIPFFFILGGLVIDLLRLRNPLRRYREYKGHRGMSWAHDWFDWLGGYPFEVARPEEIFDFYRRQGFVLERLKTVGGRLGCNEFVFRKAPAEVRTVPNGRADAEDGVVDAAPLTRSETAS